MWYFIFFFHKKRQNEFYPPPGHQFYPPPGHHVKKVRIFTFLYIPTLPGHQFHPPPGHRGVKFNILGSCWDHVGTMLGPCWDHVGTMLGSCWDPPNIHRYIFVAVLAPMLCTFAIQSFWPPHVFCLVRKQNA